MREHTVGDAMTFGVLSVKANAGLGEAVRLMEAYHVRGLAVVDGGGALVGVISETDLVHARVTEHLWDTWRGLAVRHLMTTPAVTAPTTMPLGEAARLMEDKGIHRLVVVDRDGVTPLGMLSASDLIREMAEARR